MPRFLLKQSDLNGKMFKRTRKCQKKTCLKQNENSAWKLVVDNVQVNYVKMKGRKPTWFWGLQIPISCWENWERHQKSVGRLYHSQSQLLCFTLLPFETQNWTFSLQERDSLSSHWWRGWWMMFFFPKTYMEMDLLLTGHIKSKATLHANHTHHTSKFAKSLSQWIKIWHSFSEPEPFTNLHDPLVFPVFFPAIASTLRENLQVDVGSESGTRSMDRISFRYLGVADVCWYINVSNGVSLAFFFGKSVGWNLGFGCCWIWFFFRKLLGLIAIWYVQIPG